MGVKKRSLYRVALVERGSDVVVAIGGKTTLKRAKKLLKLHRSGDTSVALFSPSCKVKLGKNS